jgi:hypothetical protein
MPTGNAQLKNAQQSAPLGEMAKVVGVMQMVDHEVYNRPTINRIHISNPSNCWSGRMYIGKRGHGRLTMVVAELDEK